MGESSRLVPVNRAASFFVSFSNLPSILLQDPTTNYCLITDKRPPGSNSNLCLGYHPVGSDQFSSGPSNRHISNASLYIHSPEKLHLRLSPKAPIPSRLLFDTLHTISSGSEQYHFAPRYIPRGVTYHTERQPQQPKQSRQGPRANKKKKKKKPWEEPTPKDGWRGGRASHPCCRQHQPGSQAGGRYPPHHCSSSQNRASGLGPPSPA